MKKTIIQYGSFAVSLIRTLISGIQYLGLSKEDRRVISRSGNILAYYPSGSNGMIEFTELLSFEERKAFGYVKMDRRMQSNYILSDMGRLMHKQTA